MNPPSPEREFQAAQREFLRMVDDMERNFGTAGLNTHALTQAYVRAAQERPGMFYVNHNIEEFEQQLHGFDAALSAAGLLGNLAKFNPAFSSYVEHRTGLSGSAGWARALFSKFGRTAQAEEALWLLITEFLAMQGCPPSTPRTPYAGEA